MCIRKGLVYHGEQDMICKRCKSKDVVQGHTKGFRTFICDDCDYEWYLKKYVKRGKEEID